MSILDNPRTPAPVISGRKVVDYFAGAGGWSIACSGLGIKLLMAINHWATAMDSHRINFPRSSAQVIDAWKVDARTLPEHDLLIASPSCVGYSVARGSDKPHHDAARMTAWAVIEVLAVRKPPMVIVENVPEITRASVYELWVQGIVNQGYKIQTVELDAVEFGVSQERTRFFLVGVRQGKPPVIRSPMLRPIPASEIIDLSGWKTWRAVRSPDRAPRTIAAVSKFRERHGDVFLYNFHGTPNARTLDRPLGTVTAAETWAVVRWPNMRMLSVSEYKAAMGFPESYRLCGSKDDQVEQLGNAVVVPVAAEVVAQSFGASPGWALRQLGFGQEGRRVSA